MQESADDHLQHWLEDLKEAWQLDVDVISYDLVQGEILNRLKTYPILREILSGSDLDIERLRKALSDSWSLGGQFDQIRINRFLNRAEGSRQAIKDLLGEFPSDLSNVAERVDAFVEKAASLGIAKPDGAADRPLAALLASVLLTALYPEGFIDFRQVRWLEFSKSLGYSMARYGEVSLGNKFVEASKFAARLAASPSFKSQWPSPKTMWVVSGIAWLFPRPKKPDPLVPPSESDLRFMEGGVKHRIHLVRERNQALVRQFKEMAISLDPYLRCEVCGFSFYEKYGELGEGVIEAHHIVPLSELSASGETTLDDLACVCSNCHTILHNGDDSPTVDQLRELIDPK